MTEKRLNRKTMNILLGTFGTRTALFMSMPYLAIYLAEVRHFSLPMTGCVLGINPLVNVLCSGFGGSMADRLSLKKIIRYVPILWGAVFALFFYADAFWQYLVLNGLNGLCYCLFEPASKKVLSTHTPPQHRLLVFNLRYTAINAGAFAGPLLSIVLHLDRTLFPYVILGGMYVVYGLSTLWFFKDMQEPAAIPGEAIAEEAKKPKSLFHAFSVIRKDRVYALLLAGMSFSFFGYAQLNATVAQTLTAGPYFSNGDKLYSTLLMQNAVIILFAQFPLLKLLSRWNSFNVILLSNGLLGFSLFLFGFSSTPLLLLVFILLFSLGELLIGARLDTLVDELATPESKGSYFGCSELIRAGGITGPVVGTWLLGQYGLTPNALHLVYGLLGAVTLMGSGLILLAQRGYRKGRVRDWTQADESCTQTH